MQVLGLLCEARHAGSSAQRLGHSAASAAHLAEASKGHYLQALWMCFTIQGARPKISFEDSGGCQAPTDNLILHFWVPLPLFNPGI